VEETIYGIQVVRRGEVGPGTIQLWKSFADGATCRTLEIMPDEVPSADGPAGFTAWRKLHFHDKMRLTFDPEHDWWVAPVGIVSIRLWLRAVDSPAYAEVDPRRAS
jgi:hypothetical protein